MQVKAGWGLAVVAGLAIILVGGLFFLARPSARSAASGRDNEAVLQIAATPDERLGMAPPVGLPAYAGLPSGAFVVAAEGAANGKPGSVEFTVPADPQGVLRFYKSAAERSGFEVQEHQEGDRRVVTARGAKGGFQAEVSAAPGQASFVRLTYG